MKGYTKLKTQIIERYLRKLAKAKEQLEDELASLEIVRKLDVESRRNAKRENEKAPQQ